MTIAVLRSTQVTTMYPAIIINPDVSKRSYGARLPNGPDNPQKHVTGCEPPEIQGDNNGKTCGVVVTLNPETTYPSTGLPNGPSSITYKGALNLGLSFSVNSWVRE